MRKEIGIRSEVVKCARNTERCVLYKFGKQILIVQVFAYSFLDIFFRNGQGVVMQLLEDFLKKGIQPIVVHLVIIDC